MKFLGISSVALIIACVQAQDLSQRSQTLPEHLVGGTTAALQNAPPFTTPQKVAEAIQNPPENVADAASLFDPLNAQIYQRHTGFNIPINRNVFVELLKRAYSHRRFDKLTIVTIMAASIKIPGSGDLKKIALLLVKEFVCRIAQTRLLQGIENNLPFILKTIDDNNTLKKGLTKSVVNAAGDIPFVGQLFKHVGQTVAGSVPGIEEALRIYRDNPLRALKALTTYLHSHGAVEYTCPASQRRPINAPILPQPLSSPAPLQPVEPQRRPDANILPLPLSSPRPLQPLQPQPQLLPPIQPQPQAPIEPAQNIPIIGATPF